MMKTKKILLTIITATLLLTIIPMDTVQATFTLIAHMDNSDTNQGSYCDGNYIFTACGADIIIYNATTHALVNITASGGDAREITGHYGFIFVTLGSSGLSAYTWNPATEKLTLDDTVNNLTVGFACGIYYDWWGSGYLYVACGLDGIFAYVFDLPTHTFTLLGQQYDGGFYNGVTTDGTNIYITTGGDGLKVYTFDGATFTQTSGDSTATTYDGLWLDITATYLYCACEDQGILVFTIGGGLTYVYQIFDGTPGTGNYNSITGNTTIVIVSCTYEGLREYTQYNGVSMTLRSIVFDGSPTDYYNSVFNEGLPYTISTKLTDGVYLYSLTGTTLSVTTNPATNITMTTATLQGRLNSGGPATVSFQWGLTISYGHNTPTQTKNNGNTFTYTLPSYTLNFNTTYHYRTKATNGINTTYGADETFITTSGGHVNTNWTSIFDGISRMFSGGSYYDSNGNYHQVTGIFGGGFDTQTLLGIFLFMILFLLTAVWGLGIMIGSVAIIPSVFAVIGYIPELKIIVAIIVGLVFGLGINRLVRR